jgi:prolyl 4-hydroxylase
MRKLSSYQYDLQPDEELNSQKQHAIRGWYLPEELVDEIIELYHIKDKNGETEPGIVNGANGKKTINLAVKYSYDYTWSDMQHSELGHKYYSYLTDIWNRFSNEFTILRDVGDADIIQPPNIQYYPPKGGFKIWHCERNQIEQPSITRQLVYMTYLTDVIGEGGQTEFLYQGISVKPKKGLTLLWSADWVHTHRGVPAETEEKMILTGWINYVHKSDYPN